MQKAINLVKLCKAAVEYYPGVIFSKRAPVDLNAVNYDTDFCYFYFSSGFEKRCFLKRSELCTGTVNAKRDFPDFKAYFDDDIKVMREYTDGKVLSFCEPWSPPGISSWVYTRKTALECKKAAHDMNESYMLGCFDLVDDITLGISKFKVIPHDSSGPSITDDLFHDGWYYDAFNALPVGMAIVDPTSNKIIHANKYWQKLSNDLVTVYGVEDAFQRHHFNTRFLKDQAAWLAGCNSEGLPQNCDIGIYGIEHGQIIVLRPSMKAVATPFWETNLVHKR
jgi:hypothetical protein